MTSAIRIRAHHSQPARRVAIMLRLATALACLLAVAGCASLQSSDSFLGFITPYRIEIVQGNVVTKEQVDAVKVGMSRAQVRDILGSPLLTDPFHADRWDYLFTIKRPGAQPQRRSLVARFEGDRLAKLETPDELPDERAFVASISTAKASGEVPTLELTEELRRALPPPPKQPEAAASQPAPAGPTREYPPLEPR
jgi:outer membrane protein assembly factor BamE